MAIHLRASDVITDDVFVRLSELIPGVEVLVKLEGLNPAGSIKLKTAVALVEGAIEKDLLRPGRRIIESSSGNLGIALSMVGAERCHPVTIVTDPNATRQSVAAMRAFGADVVEVTARDPNGGFLQTRIDYIHAAIARDPTLVWLNQYANADNIRAHHRRTAGSIHRELGQVDVLIVGVGTAGTLMGCVEYFNRNSPQTRIVAVDAEGSVTFGGSAGQRRIPGLGASRRPEIYVDGGFEKLLVAEMDTIEMCRRLAREYGLLVGGSTGTALVGATRIADTIPDASRVVVISPDLGDRYLSLIYSDDWVRENYPDAVTVA
ncbi:2,3-diaminopropionate biosynthesis protein SbnA [Frankia sp. QA3]|uniref:2,3-diaminopropionate biosynthesis protein SbnA n=1 Tax=Frankia sp. QA3 TaxID=710111 RepID=UPI000269BD6F|nr:2,3-diaminopropionate biosynthesis protein SbnA [Frankia sp. QA3]EIV93027.1 2,3-diaminopropionate biosynthesis protein SbnA [Frankia sp. QA3]